MNDINETVRKNVVRIRHQRGMARHELAELADLSVDTLHKLERGRRCISLTTLGKLATGLEVEPADLLVE